MNKFSLTICFCLSFLFLMSCESPDLTDELNADWSSVNCTPVDDNMWSPKSPITMTLSDAVDYCDNLNVCGYSDWHLPTISELRTLIKNCSATKTGGSCGVTDSCLSSSCRNDACHGCADYNDSGYHRSKKYSKLGDAGDLRSSSLLSDDSDQAWFVDFGYMGGRVESDAATSTGNINTDYYVRCVR